MELKNNSIISKLNRIDISLWYYIIVFLSYMLTLFVSDVKPGVFATIMMLLVLIQLLITNRVKLENTMDILILVYFCYNILSFIWLTKSNMGISVFAAEFVSSVLPIIFYFVGKTCKDKTERFYELFIIAVLMIGIYGIVLFILAPRFYIDYAYRMSFISKPDAATLHVRMESVIGCTVMAFLGCTSMAAGLTFVMNKNVKKVIKGIIYIFISLVITLMANMRSSMVVAILIIIYANVLVFFEFKIFKKKYFVMECIALAVIFAALCAVRFDLVLKIWWRLISLPGAVSQRSEQWIAAVNNVYSTWLGNGLGANGHRALSVEGAHVIADGGLIKMYCEEGVIGFSMFLYIIILAVSKNIRRLSESYVEIAIVAGMLLTSIGSNIICFQPTTPIFWFAVGRLSYLIGKDSHLNRRLV